MEKNDPKLTAFVLGELSEAEANEVQAALAADAELREEVEAIRKTVTEIEDFMRTEPLPSETKVSTPGATDTPETKPKKRRWYVPTIPEILVLVAIGFVVIALMNPALQKASPRSVNRYLARTQETDTDMPAAENTPINGDLRYEPEDIDIFEEESVELNLNSGMNAPAEELRELDGKMRQEFARGLPEQSKMGETPKMEVATANMGEMMALEALQSMMGVSPKSKGSLERRKRVGVAHGGLPASPPVPEERGSVTMMVTPRVIVQEEEEEYLIGVKKLDEVLAREDDPRMEALKKEKEKHLAGTPATLAPADPYNSANDETYKDFVENDFLRPRKAPFSTFSIDVDTAAYTTMRRYINQGQKPPAASVRLEEYVNYFKYDYSPPTGGTPFATHVDVAPCPWESKHLLARIGIKGKEYTVDERPPLNLVFLIDTSGSMSSSNRLPLVQRGLTELVEMLQPKDRVAIVTYAGSSKVALPSVSGQEKRAILDSINSLRAGGSTAGAAGIKTAYETARKYYDKEAQNRVILCTDGDFNVGTTDNKTLEQMIGEEAKSGVFLTILGFGMGNYKDERLKTLSMRGNGNYGYIDTIEEARRLLVEGLTGTLFAIAKDVKIQVDFNPSRVTAYRLLGYENRKLRDEDFHNDKIDAGEIGAGHTVTALYEIVPVGGTVPSKVDESRYADKESDDKEGDAVRGLRSAASSAHSEEIMFVKLRYKQPDGDKSSLLEYPVVYDSETKLSGDAEFAAGVALYGMLLRFSRYSGAGNFDTVLELAEPNVKDDPYRKEFVDLVKKAKKL